MTVGEVVDSGATPSSGSGSNVFDGSSGYGSLPKTAASVLNPQLPIPDRLGIEAGNRSAESNPKADAVFKAFTAAGVNYSPPIQHMASTYQARFCVGSKTQPDEGLAISVCEYATAAEATDGKALAEKLLKSAPNVTVARNKTTTLRFIVVKPTPENKALEAKMIKTFQAL